MSDDPAGAARNEPQASCTMTNCQGRCGICAPPASEAGHREDGDEGLDPLPPATLAGPARTVRLDMHDVAGHCDHFAYHEASDTVTLWHTHNGIPIGTRATGTLAQAREAIRKARAR